MAKNMKKHICNDSCKGRFVNTISCFLCGELFYAKCFSFDTPTQTKINSIDSCLKFVCGICQTNCSTNKRKSLGSPIDNSQSSTNTTNDGNLNDDIKKILEILSTRSSGNSTVNDNSNCLDTHQYMQSNLTTKIDTISNDLKQLISSINGPNIHMSTHDENRQLNENQQLISLHAKLDHFISTVKNPNNSIHDSVIQSLDDLQCKMDVIVADPHFINKRNTCLNKQQNGNNNNNKIKSKSADELEWSFSFNHSLNAANMSENTDIFTMITSFEQSTWAGLDLLSKKLSDQHKSVLNIETLCRNFEGNTSHSSNNGCSNKNDQQIPSPLMDAINIDTLQQIQNKCDSIERNLSSIVTRASSCSNDEVPSCKMFNKSVQSSQSSQHSLDELSSIPLIDNAQLHGETNAEHMAGIPLNMSLNDLPSNGVPDNSHSCNAVNAVRVAANLSLNTACASSQTGAGTHNTTEIFSNTLLLNELDISNDVQDDNDDFNANSQPIIHTNIAPSNKLQRHFHLSKISTNTTTDMIYDHMRKNGVSETSNIKVTKLVPLNRDLSTLSFISFKIDTTDDIANIINAPKFWPQNCSWKNFIPKKRPMGIFSNTASFLGERRPSPNKST